MTYYRPIKIISSVGKAPRVVDSVGPVVIVSDTAPTTREDSSALQVGDFWWDNTTDKLNIYIVDEWKATDNPSDVQLVSPNGTTFSLQVDDDGTLTTQQL